MMDGYDVRPAALARAGLDHGQTAQVVDMTEDHVSSVLNRSRMALAAD